MSRGKSRWVVVISRGNQDRPPIAVGPFTKRELAQRKAQKIADYMEEKHDLWDGTDIEVDVVMIEPSSTALREIAEMIS